MDTVVARGVRELIGELVRDCATVLVSHDAHLIAALTERVLPSALDPEVGAAVLDLLDELRRTLGLTVLLVTHDLSVAARCAQRVAVLDRGRVVEQGDTAAVLAAPRHPTTIDLVRSAPGLQEAAWR